LDPGKSGFQTLKDASVGLDNEEHSCCTDGQYSENSVMAVAMAEMVDVVDVEEMAKVAVQVKERGTGSLKSRIRKCNKSFGTHPSSPNPIDAPDIVHRQIAQRSDNDTTV